MEQGTYIFLAFKLWRAECTKKDSICLEHKKFRLYMNEKAIVYSYRPGIPSLLRSSCYRVPDRKQVTCGGAAVYVSVLILRFELASLQAFHHVKHAAKWLAFRASLRRSCSLAA